MLAPLLGHCVEHFPLVRSCNGTWVLVGDGLGIHYHRSGCPLQSADGFLQVGRQSAQTRSHEHYCVVLLGVELRKHLRHFFDGILPYINVHYALGELVAELGRFLRRCLATEEYQGLHLVAEELGTHDNLFRIKWRPRVGSRPETIRRPVLYKL